LISSFHLSQLQNLLRDFYNLTQIRITVFDEQMEELISFPSERASFCQLIRKDPAALKNCIHCDRQALSTARERHSPYIYRCHAGMTEAVTPIYLNSLIIGYLFFGHVFSYDSYEEGIREIQHLCAPYGIDLPKLEHACQTMPLLSKEYILSASHILEAVASYLCLERMATLKKDPLPVQIDRYIADHLAEDLKATDLCRQFHIGKTYLYEIAKQSYGTGIAEHIRRLRLEKAKSMLTEHPAASIGEIAAQCGFNDYNYFFSAFKKFTGLSPKSYRSAVLSNQDMATLNSHPKSSLP
jgi:AraC-like DNA-binding protein